MMDNTSELLSFRPRDATSAVETPTATSGDNIPINDDTNSGATGVGVVHGRINTGNFRAAVDANNSESRRDPYNYEGLKGWRSYRALRLGRGIYYDIKRRLPYYFWSDWQDSLTYRTVASTIRIYFVK